MDPVTDAALPLPHAGAVPGSPAEAPTRRGLVVKVTCGTEAPERLSQAFTVAATAVASGIETTMFLTGESTWLAVPGRAAQFALPHAAPLADLLATVVAEGRVSVCTQCAARRELSEQDLLDGIDIRGAAAFVELATRADTTALVY